MPHDVIETYLAELETRLPAALRNGSAVVAEVAGSLNDAVEDNITNGMSRAEAEHAAIEEFGSPAEVAGEFAPVAAAAQVHRYGLRFLVTGPLIGFLWLTTAALSSADGLLPTTELLLVVLTLVIVTAAGSAGFSVLATGHSAHWVPAKITSALGAVTITARCVVIGDLVLLTLLALHVTTAPGAVAALPATAATLASITRIALAVHGARSLRSTSLSLR